MKLFVFDHCPFCIKAMMVAGLKKADIELVYLQNHDVDARIDKVGANLVPILQKKDGSYMAESLDIAAYIDALDGNPILATGSNDDNISAWADIARPFSSRLLYPRWMKVDLPEFQCEEAKAWFTKNKTAMIEQDFDDAFSKSDAYLAELNASFDKLSWLQLPSERNNVLSYDDVNLFPSLRNLTVVKGVKFPARIRQYIDEVAALTSTSLYDDIAV
ncbi:glutaredoxin 2 [Photobacterium gaetbulicola]|uniref:Glutaredoxin 2 n=1 Tax=Photobacterium gaetbulicola Gung47 TaxID=658445 RepID=A0A0C5W8G3_9GAMM|nr:glutaredoxin 2 [Photobacterium gaetbulicola]AJR07831.1 glutaredoxin 2 [Photobacterium gaetbulicola Gung47]PST98932.1 glutaredoxin 2 [Photobacterium gaetbulicola]